LLQPSKFSQHIISNFYFMLGFSINLHKKIDPKKWVSSPFLYLERLNLNYVLVDIFGKNRRIILLGISSVRALFRIWKAFFQYSKQNQRSEFLDIEISQSAIVIFQTNLNLRKYLDVKLKNLKSTDCNYIYWKHKNGMKILIRSEYWINWCRNSNCWNR